MSSAERKGVVGEYMLKVGQRRSGEGGGYWAWLGSRKKFWGTLRLPCLDIPEPPPTRHVRPSGSSWSAYVPALIFVWRDGEQKQHLACLRTGPEFRKSAAKTRCGGRKYGCELTFLRYQKETRRRQQPNNASFLCCNLRINSFQQLDCHFWLNFDPGKAVKGI
ncbi:hypothetical protein E2C01_004516 [Portunus trituberculatus]|uniref:Uncharacterized protein n=1 Tax=Portunus trituberculatus TaxID=210409 RepID=A0A5B7CQW0_PORTR|nr:hypothetical protein [Portunus trituberculatus]